ncbi:MAG: FAD-dependent oxidoreductase [Pusillimonas sp.]
MSERSVVIVGAGIVGICIAFHLKRAGYSVTLLDMDDPARRCSFGNAGALSEHSVAPLAMPGILRSAVSMLLRPSSPLSVQTSYWLKVGPWLWRFAMSAGRKQVMRAASSLHGLLDGSIEHHVAMAREVGCLDLIRRNGQLHVYPNDRMRQADAESWCLKKRFGLRMELVGRAEIRDLEPALNESYTVGWYLPGEAWVSDPYGYARCIVDFATQMGVTFERAAVRSISTGKSGWVASDGIRDWTARHLIVAAGSWSKELLKPLGLSVPLEAQRGYHLQAKSGTEASVNRVVVLADRKVFITPTKHGVRAAGTVEFGGLVKPSNPARLDALSSHVRAGFGKALFGVEEPATWMGHRPCLPDSMPVIGPVPDRPGLWCAFGHGHLGLTGSVNTARHLTGMMTGHMDGHVLAPFSIQRFLA